MPSTTNKRKRKKAKRRKKGTGSIRPHGRGFEAAITIVNPDTGRAERIVESFATEEEADVWLGEQALSIKLGRSNELLGIPFVRLVEEYRKWRRLELEAHDIGQDQFDADEGRIENHLLPYFRDWRLNQMTVFVIETYLKEKVAGVAPVAVDDNGAPLARAKLAPQSVHKHVALLNGMFKLAQKINWVSENPVEMVDRPKLDDVPVEALTLNQTRRLLILIPLEKRNLTLVQLHLGLRSGEARGIRRHDVSFNPDGGGELRVRGAVKRIKFEGDSTAKLVYVERLKSYSGWRNIPFGPMFGAILKDQIAIADGRPDPNREELIFRTTTGQPLSGDNYRNQVYLPAVSAALFKLMTDAQRRRLLNSVPEELQLATEMLALEDVSVNNVLTGTWDGYNVATHELAYIDGDGEERVVKVPLAIHTGLMQQKADIEELGIPNKRNLLFPGKKSMQIKTQSYLSIVFRRAWKAATLGDDRRLHRLRHTYASAMAGEIKLRDLQRFVGHKRMSTTADLYVHFYERKNAPLGDTMGLYRDTEAA
jgi:integrase